MRHNILPPTTKESILKTLEQVNHKIADDFGQFSPAVFQQRQGTHWSPAEHLRHLTKCVRALSKALTIPGPLLRLRFGASNRPSKSYDDIRAEYLKSLAENDSAGSWAPEIEKPNLSEAEYQKKLLSDWDRTWRQLNQNLQKWEESRLDRYLLPHPRLSKITVREMLFFTVYHNSHHGNRVLERSGKTGKTTLSRFGD